MMQYTFLGKTGMKVSRLSLGTMNFASQTSEQDCFHMMDEVRTGTRSNASRSSALTSANLPLISR